jgi:aspartyl protease family protein
MSRADAIRARLDLDRAQPITTMTADGPVRSWKVTAKEVRLGEVVVQDVDVAVLEASLPMVLLGMSFLNRVQMRQDGREMTLGARQ